MNCCSILNGYAPRLKIEGRPELGKLKPLGHNARNIDLSQETELSLA